MNLYSPLKYFGNLISEAPYYFYPLKSFIKFNIPFFSQWESSELADELLEGKTKAGSDKKWKRSGARDQEEYELWSWNICGISCLKMVLAFKYNKNIPSIILAKKCAEYGGYFPDGAKNGDIPGLFYLPFCEFIEKEFGLRGKVADYLTPRRIKGELSQGNFVISSVHHDIRDVKNKTPKKKGGHLILMTGYDEKKGSFFIHNPSGFYKKSQIHYKVSYNDFDRFFAGRGIVIGEKN